MDNYKESSSYPSSSYPSSSSISPEKSSLVKIEKSDVWSGGSGGPKVKKKKKVETNVRRDMMSFTMYTDYEEFKEEEKLPDRIEGSYFYDYNILTIHEILLKKFAQDRKNQLINLNNKIEQENIKISGKQNLIQRKNSRKKIEELEKQIYEYEHNIYRDKYLESSQKKLEKYTEIGPISSIVSFTHNIQENEIISPESPEEQSYRHKIIFNYLEIARKYITIDLIRTLPNSNSCINCNTNEEEMIEDESGSSICPNCGLERINIVKTQFYSDGTRLNNSKNNYDERGNFYKVLMRYQGKQINKPGKELYEKLDEYFVSRGLPTSKEYHQMPLLADRTKLGTCKDMMYEALSGIGCSGYYDDINLVCSVYFGWVLDDVSHLEDQIMEDYDTFKKVFEQLDLEGRKSSLNSQWTLYILLKRTGWPCKTTNFKIPCTPSILEFHKIKTKEVYKILSWECPF